MATIPFQLIYPITRVHASVAKSNIKDAMNEVFGEQLTRIEDRVKIIDDKQNLNTKEIKDELKDHQDFVTQMKADLIAKTQAVLDRLNTLRSNPNPDGADPSELERVTADLTAKTNEMTACAESLEKLKKELEPLKQQLKEAKNTIAEGAGKESAEVAQAKKEADELQEQIYGLQEQHEKDVGNIVNLARTAVNVADQATETEFANEVSKIPKTYNGYVVLITELREKLRTRLIEAGQHERDIAAAKKEKEDCEKELSTVTKDLEKSRKDVEDREARITGLWEEKMKLKDEMNEKETDIAVFQWRETIETGTADEKIREQREKLDVLDSKLKRQEGLLEEARVKAEKYGLTISTLKYSEQHATKALDSATEERKKAEEKADGYVQILKDMLEGNIKEDTSAAVAAAAAKAAINASAAAAAAAESKRAAKAFTAEQMKAAAPQRVFEPRDEVGGTPAQWLDEGVAAGTGTDPPPPPSGDGQGVGAEGKDGGSGVVPSSQSSSEEDIVDVYSLAYAQAPSTPTSGGGSGVENTPSPPSVIVKVQDFFTPSPPTQPPQTEGGVEERKGEVAGDGQGGAVPMDVDSTTPSPTRGQGDPTTPSPIGGQGDPPPSPSDDGQGGGGAGAGVDGTGGGEQPSTPPAEIVLDHNTDPSQLVKEKTHDLFVNALKQDGSNHFIKGGSQIDLLEKFAGVIQSNATKTKPVGVKALKSMENDIFKIIFKYKEIAPEITGPKLLYQKFIQDLQNGTLRRTVHINKDRTGSVSLTASNTFKLYIKILQDIKARKSNFPFTNTILIRLFLIVLGRFGLTVKNKTEHLTYLEPGFVTDNQLQTKTAKKKANSGFDLSNLFVWM